MRWKFKSWIKTRERLQVKYGYNTRNYSIMKVDKLRIKIRPTDIIFKEKI